MKNTRKDTSIEKSKLHSSFDGGTEKYVQGEKYFKNGQKLTDNLVAYIKQQDSKDKGILEQDKVNAIMNKVLNSCNPLNSCQ